MTYLLLWSLEIARRLAKICNAPFIKVEATKYTETGYHGSDVDTIIKDLVNVGIAQRKKILREQSLEQVNKAVEDKLLALLLGEYPPRWEDRLRSMLRDGTLDDIEVKVPFIEPVGGDDEAVNTFRLVVSADQGSSFQSLHKDNVKWVCVILMNERQQSTNHEVRR